MGKKIPVIAHPDIWQAKYARYQNKPDRYIGIPFQPGELESLGARFNLERSPTVISENVLTTGEVPMVTDFERIDGNLFVQKDSRWYPDQLLDDQALLIKTESGLVVLLGCGHRGVINTLYHARQLTGVTRIYAVIGGAHLIGVSENQLSKTIDALRGFQIERLGLCHCTGLPAATRLCQEFGSQFFFNKAGTVLEIP